MIWVFEGKDDKKDTQASEGKNKAGETDSKDYMFLEASQHNCFWEGMISEVLGVLRRRHMTFSAVGP